eukprot:scaffold6196_cov113-Isochrysis_galbana.AAC.9
MSAPYPIKWAGGSNAPPTRPGPPSPATLSLSVGDERASPSWRNTVNVPGSIYAICTLCPDVSYAPMRCTAWALTQDRRVVAPALPWVRSFVSPGP